VAIDNTSYQQQYAHNDIFKYLNSEALASRGE